MYSPESNQATRVFAFVTFALAQIFFFLWVELRSVGLLRPHERQAVGLPVMAAALRGRVPNVNVSEESLRHNHAVPSIFSRCCNLAKESSSPPKAGVGRARGAAGEPCGRGPRYPGRQMFARRSSFRVLRQISLLAIPCRADVLSLRSRTSAV